MADVVIVVGTRRGRENVPLSDIVQMTGRAGRRHEDVTCEAHVLVEEEREVEVIEGLSGRESMEVESSLRDINGVIFHIMPEIKSGAVSDIASAEKWYSRSLASAQGNKIDFKNVFKELEKLEAVRNIGSGYRITALGEIASDLYFHPGDILSWKENFTRIFQMEVEYNSTAIAWAIGTRRNSKIRGDFDQHRYVIGICKDSLPMGLNTIPGTVIEVVLWFCALGGAPAGKMRTQMLEIREDIGRIKRALLRIDREVCRWDKEEYFDDIAMMVTMGIRSNLLELCRIHGITKSRAQYLYDNGAKTVEDIPEVMRNISDEIDEPFLSVLERVSGEIVK